jgi:hypothetical protein
VSLAALALALDLAAVAPPVAERCAIAAGRDRVPVHTRAARFGTHLAVDSSTVRAIRPGAAGAEPEVEVAGVLRFRGELARDAPSPRLRFHLTRAVTADGVRLPAGAFADALEAHGPRA